MSVFVNSTIAFICCFELTSYTWWFMTLWWQEKDSKPVAMNTILPLNLCEKLTFQREAVSNAGFKSRLGPQPPPPECTLCRSSPSLSDTERILWTDDTTSPFKPAEQIAWLTSCLHSQPLTFTLHRLLTLKASVSILCWDIA